MPKPLREDVKQMIASLIEWFIEGGIMETLLLFWLLLGM